jgi:hypothetical protein
VVARLCILLAFRVGACAGTEYRYDFMNDLSYPVVVTGCDYCADGRHVQPNAKVRLALRPGERIKINRTDGVQVGCGTAPRDGGSTSDTLPVEASLYVSSVCE